jgi:Uncharacterized protein conserved in bacteria
MDDIFEMSLLLDFYGQMLTDRQFEIMDLHFNDDLSLSEISQQLGISRQGVHDNIKRGKATLFEYEQKLKLVEKFAQQKNQAVQALELVKTIDKNNLSDDDSQKLAGIEKVIREIIQTV